MWWWEEEGEKSELGSREENGLALGLGGAVAAHGKKPRSRGRLSEAKQQQDHQALEERVG